MWELKLFNPRQASNISNLYFNGEANEALNYKKTFNAESIYLVMSCQQFH